MVTVPPLVSQHSLREAVAQAKEKSLLPVRILVAEDNLVNQKVALGQLYTLGYRAEAVGNGRELLEALEHTEVDVILMDCQMPEMDGFDATAEVRRREGTSRHTIIIAMTANALEGETEKCLAAGMDDYLSKPVKQDLLRAKLAQWTGPASIMHEANEVGPTANGSVIDRKQMAMLRQVQPPERPDFVTELIDMFLRDAANQLVALHAAVAQENAAEMQCLAHRLRGSSANLGAMQMSALFAEFEELDAADNAAAILTKLDNEFERVRVALEAERGIVE
jgi:two-component system, sensor histidine kinase and response regulator